MLQWDGLENKTTVVVYAGGALVALWLSSTIVGAINSVPLVCPSYPMNHRNWSSHANFEDVTA